MIKIRSKVGKRGEIYISKEIQEMLKIQEGDEIIFSLENDKLIIEKGDSLEEFLALLDLPPLIDKSVDAIEASLDQMRSEAEQHRELSGTY